jgi:thiaminase/transcriptional activator TenA
MTLVDELMQVSQGIWAREKEHPFVRGLGDGTLPAERFRFYLEQDYLFLIEYAKVFALAATRSTELATMAYFAQLCADTLNTEMALHRSTCAEFGITPAELEAAEPAQTTVGYTGHLLQVAVRGGVADICAAVLPCQWGYHEIARHLRARGMPPEPRYRKWIELYASPEFAAYGRWLRETLEAHAPHLAPAHVARLKTTFHTSSRWEYLFWEMAWRMERWSVPEG